MAGLVQVNVRMNEECREALERYRFKREKTVRETLPKFRLSLNDAFRMLILDTLQAEEKEEKKP
jgi:hypothetical protein